MIKPLGLKPVPGLISIYQNIQKQRIPVPVEMAFLQKDALDSLFTANIEVVDAGGRLYIADCWRSAEAQYKNWFDYKIGRKKSYSPPPGMSMHQCGRAIDIDTRAEQLRIPHQTVQEILGRHNWFPVVNLGSPGDYHYEHRDTLLQKKLREENYFEMVKTAFSTVKHASIIYGSIDYAVEEVPSDWK